jgi:hypothetical protein
VKEFLAAGESARVHLERLPPYAPSSTQMRAYGGT